MQGQGTLLLRGFDRHEFYVGPGGGRAQRRRISGVVLLALLHERLYRLGRDQLHVVSKTGQYTAPMMRCAACLHDDPAGVLLLELCAAHNYVEPGPDIGASRLL